MTGRGLVLLMGVVAIVLGANVAVWWAQDRAIVRAATVQECFRVSSYGRLTTTDPWPEGCGQRVSSRQFEMP